MRSAITATGWQLILTCGGTTGLPWSTVASWRSLTGGTSNGRFRCSIPKPTSISTLPPSQMLRPRSPKLSRSVAQPQWWRTSNAHVGADVPVRPERSERVRRYFWWKFVIRKQLGRSAAPQARTRALGPGAVVRSRSFQSERRALYRSQWWRHHLAMDHLDPSLLLAAGYCGDRTLTSLSRRRRSLPLGERGVRRLPRVSLRLVLLDQPDALRPNRHALLRWRFGFRFWSGASVAGG